MGIKVKDLIKKLQKMPQDLQVYWADHDHGRYETNNTAGCVELIDKAEMRDDGENDKGDGNWNGGHDPTFQDTPKRYVCIRP